MPTRMPRLRLKTKLVLAISAMVFALVLGLTSIYLAQLVRQRIDDTYNSGDVFAKQTYQVARGAIEVDLAGTAAGAGDPAQLRTAVFQALQADPGVSALMQSIVGYSPIIYDVAITDTDGKAIIHSDPEMVGKVVQPRMDFAAVRNGGIRRQLAAVFGAPQVYEVRVPLELNDQPFGAVRVGVSTVLLRSELKPLLDRALIFSGIAIFLSLLLAALLSSFALRPLEAIGRRLDAMTAGGPEPPPAREPRDEVGAVTSKIDRLGRQIRDAKEIFSALKENLDQLMANLQDGLALFTSDARAVLVSASAEGFLGKPRGDVLGRDVHEIFDDRSRLGMLVLDAFALHRSLDAVEIESENGRRIQVSLDFIEQGGEGIGALLTLRDAESARRIEDEIELSRRQAALGRLTRGVAHEVKNPINAIVVHLEILRGKLAALADAGAQRHMDVINSEIQRLDRVVQMLVDFTRPVELHLADLDLRRVLDDVAALAAPDAARQGVSIVRSPGGDPLPARADADLLKQALLNVVLNGVQSMPGGGELRLTATRRDASVTIDVADQGGGIPPNVRDKIFDLYFTTKEAGSGIGLATAYKVLQLHHGSIDFDTSEGRGTTFHLHLPLADARPFTPPTGIPAAQGEL
jgi:signal transduction histidine kinase/HAMP domain-containing protein